LLAFYGRERSFCKGILFDTTDFIIEFTVNHWEGMKPIEHHRGSYRGHIHCDNIKIIAMYVKDKPLDYNIPEFEQHFKTLVEQIPFGTKIHRYKSCSGLSDYHVMLISTEIKT